MSFLPNVLFSFRQWVPPPDISLPHSKITFYDIQISTRPNKGLIIDCKSTVWATGCPCWTIGLILLAETCCILTFWEDWQNPVLWERQVGSVNDFKAVYSDLFCLVLPKTVSSSLKLITRKCSNSKKPKKKLDCLCKHWSSSEFFLHLNLVKYNITLPSVFFLFFYEIVQTG